MTVEYDVAWVESALNSRLSACNRERPGVASIVASKARVYFVSLSLQPLRVPHRRDLPTTSSSAPYCDTIVNHPLAFSPIIATLAEPSPAIGAVTHGKMEKSLVWGRGS